MSFYSPVSRPSKSNTSEWVSQQVAKAMVWSDFGLSCFDYPLDRKNRDTVCTLLTDLPFQIVAVWVVGRPVNGYSNSGFEHWCVKIQAPPALISIDFLESKKKGAFGLQQTTATDAELSDFLHYYVRDENGKTKRKWGIISSATPSPLKNTSYLNCIDDHDLNKLKSFMKKNNKNSNAQLVTDININRKVCDISDFLGMWTESQSKNQTIENEKTIKNEKTYNPITGNCQQFAADLFEYLVGHKAEYFEKVKEVQANVQSPYDKLRYNVKELILNHDDDEKKQEIIEEQKPLKVAETNARIMNNPQTNLIIDSD